MRDSRHSHGRGFAVALLIGMGAAPVMGAETVAATQDQSQTAATGQVQERFIHDFGAFAGSDDNARSLYTGLKNGMRITLAAPTTTTSGGITATPVLQFDPPTRPMGNGNVFISLALAKQQLANYGITNPTPQQLQAALTGGTIIPAGTTAQPVVLKGILVQRADGMGWGSIAKASGMNLGKVVSGIKSGNTVTANGASAGGTGRVATAAGTGGQALNAGRGKSAYVSSSGMVSATGSPVGAGFNNTHAQAGGLNAGVATAGGISSPGRSAASPQGQGKGLIRQ